jgi:hypothetical protein
MPAMRRLTVSLLAAACVLGATACGSGGTEAVDPGTYTRSVCQALSVWQQRLTEGSTILVQRTNAATNLKDVRRDFVSFFGGAIAETNTMLDAVGAAGVPDVNDGEAVAAALLRALRRFRSIFVDAAADARRLPVGSEQALAKKTQTLGIGYREEAVKLPTLLETIAKAHEAPELVRLATTNAACNSLAFR